MDHQVFAQLLGNYGEFIGSIAVLVTLVYLAIQIRQNTRAMESTRRHELARMDQDGLIAFAGHAAVLSKINSEQMPEWDSPAEQEEAYWLVVAGFRSWENTIWQHENGFFDTKEFTAMLEDIVNRARYPFYAEHWQRWRHTYSPNLRSVFDPIFERSSHSGELPA